MTTNSFDYDWLIGPNPGVNPSLSITAIAESAISHVPPAGAIQH